MDKLDHDGLGGRGYYKRRTSGDESTFIRDPEPKKFTLTLVSLQDILT